jgi:hypothetical protein
MMKRTRARSRANILEDSNKVNTVPRNKVNMVLLRKVNMAPPNKEGTVSHRQGTASKAHMVNSREDTVSSSSKEEGTVSLKEVMEDLQLGSHRPDIHLSREDMVLLLLHLPDTDMTINRSLIGMQHNALWFFSTTMPISFSYQHEAALMCSRASFGSLGYGTQITFIYLFLHLSSSIF